MAREDTLPIGWNNLGDAMKPPTGNSAQDQVNRIAARIQYLQGIAQKTDEDGTPSADSFAANDELDTLYRELLNWTKLAQITPSQASWSAGNTSSPYLVRQAQDGSLQQMPNPNYKPAGSQPAAQRAPLLPEEQEYQQLQSEALRQKMFGGQLFEYDRQTEEEKRRQQNQQWEKTWGMEQQKFAMDQQKQAEQQRQFEATQAQRKREAAWTAANDMNETQIKALPYAAMPGQQYQVGYEPGGVMQNIAGMSGRGYDAEKYRAPIIQYDPEEAWRKAMGMLGQ